MLKQTEISELFTATKAYLSGHFLLSSGLHSPNYFQCALVLQHPEHAALLCTDLAKRYQAQQVDLVISPAIGGIVAGQEVARALQRPAIFAERENGTMTLRRGFKIEPGQKILVVEDVFTTGKSIREVAAVVNACKGQIAGIGVLVDRSGGKADLGAPVESLMQMEVVVYEPDDCPLCRDNVPLIKPGSRTPT